MMNKPTEFLYLAIYATRYAPVFKALADAVDVYNCNKEGDRDRAISLASDHLAAAVKVAAEKHPRELTRDTDDLLGVDYAAIVLAAADER